MQEKKIKLTGSFYLFCLILVGALAYGMWIAPRMQHIQTVTVGGHTFSVEIADTEAKRNQGLGGRENIAADGGMLFVFERQVIPSFWMPDMKFPIDIIWIREGRVIGVEENVPADGGIKRYSPRDPIDWVLEFAAGTVAKRGIHVGDSVVLSS